MSKRKDTTGADSNGYTVGYGKPPTHSRFRPGKSGNPAGRRKGVRNFGTDVKRILRVPVKVKEGARSRKVSTQEGALMVLREKALKGDARSLDGLLEYASGYNNDADEIGLAQGCLPMTKPSSMPTRPKSRPPPRHPHLRNLPG